MAQRLSWISGLGSALAVFVLACSSSSTPAPGDAGKDAKADGTVPKDGGGDGGDGAAEAGPWPTPPAWNAPVKRPASDSAAQAARAACTFKRGDMPAASLDPSFPLDAKNPITNVVVLIQENHSFDTYMGHLYKYAKKAMSEINSAPDTTTNPDSMGGTHPYQHGPQLCFSDTDHSWRGSHLEWDNGKNDGFYEVNEGMQVTEAGVNLEDGDRALWWYDERDIPFYYDLYNTFAISDAYFCGLLGPTYPNRDYAYAATSLGATNDNVFADISKFPTLPSNLVIFDELAQRNVSFGIYSESLPGLLTMNPSLLVRFKPLTAFHQATDFFAAAKAGTLPAVSFVDPNFQNEKCATADDEHPPSSIQLGQDFVWKVVNAVLTSPQWAHTALFITYDEHGGEYDHVPPPPACAPDDIKPILSGSDVGVPGAFDRYGFRVPLVIVSPYAKKSYVSHAVNSHTSILRFIEAVFKLPALTARDANSDAFTDMFDWTSPPFMKPPTFTEPAVDMAAEAFCKSTYGQTGGTCP